MTGATMKVPKGTRVRDRERPTTQVVGTELRATRPRGEVRDLASDGAESFVLHVANDGCEEALVVEVDGDAEVDMIVQDETSLGDRRVEIGVLLQRLDECARDEREVGERESLVPLPALLD